MIVGWQVNEVRNQTRLTATAAAAVFAAAAAATVPPPQLASAMTMMPSCIGSECDDEVTAAVWVRQLPGKMDDRVEWRLLLRQRRRQRLQQRRHPLPWQPSAQPLRVRHQQARLKDLRKRAETCRRTTEQIT